MKSGISFIGALQLLFIGLKLSGNLNWSWYWVLAPYWIGCLVFVLWLVLLALLRYCSRRK